MPEAEQKARRPLMVRYLKEVAEAFVYMTIILLMLDKEYSFTKVIRTSLVVGGLTTLIEAFDKDTHNNIKQGMTFTVGSNLIAT